MFHSMTASRTTPTLCVFVIRTGVPRQPDSSSQAVPVISPLPFMLYHAPNTRPRNSLPCGNTAVTPVLTGPLPTTSFPSPAIKVVCPTATPFTSVMAFRGARIPFEGNSQVSCTSLGLGQTTRHGGVKNQRNNKSNLDHDGSPAGVDDGRRLLGNDNQVGR